MEALQQSLRFDWPAVDAVVADQYSSVFVTQERDHGEKRKRLLLAVRLSVAPLEIKRRIHQPIEHYD